MTNDEVKYWLTYFLVNFGEHKTWDIDEYSQQPLKVRAKLVYLVNRDYLKWDSDGILVDDFSMGITRKGKEFLNDIRPY